MNQRQIMMSSFTTPRSSSFNSLVGPAVSFVDDGHQCLPGRTGQTVGPTLTPEKDVRPILKQHCFHCHGEAGVMEANLDVRPTTISCWREDSGAAILPVMRTTAIGESESGEMPPGEEMVSVDEIAIIKQWLNLGAFKRDRSRRLWTRETTSHRRNGASGPSNRFGDRRYPRLRYSEPER